jgi:hypothetical protein
MEIPVDDVAEDLGAAEVPHDLDAAADPVAVRPKVAAVRVVLDVLRPG